MRRRSRPPPDEVVTNDELMGRVWHGAIVEENCLDQGLDDFKGAAANGNRDRVRPQLAATGVDLPSSRIVDQPLVLRRHRTTPFQVSGQFRNSEPRKASAGPSSGQIGSDHGPLRIVEESRRLHDESGRCGETMIISLRLQNILFRIIQCLPKQSARKTCYELPIREAGHGRFRQPAGFPKCIGR